MSGAPAVALLTAEQITELVKAAVTEALDEQEPVEQPLLVDRRTMARMLSVGVDTLDRLRREGLPVVRVGDQPRFHPADCLDFLRSKK